MNAFADKAYVSDLHAPQVRFGGDVPLEPRTEGFAKQISECGKDDRERNQPDTPKGGSSPSKRHPGKGRREKRRSRHVGSTARVDRESAFAREESRHGFQGGRG